MSHKHHHYTLDSALDILYLTLTSVLAILLTILAALAYIISMRLPGDPTLTAVMFFLFINLAALAGFAAFSAVSQARNLFGGSRETC